jgi:hypothetical protein
LIEFPPTDELFEKTGDVIPFYRFPLIVPVGFREKNPSSDLAI